ncbi:DUF3089 domain-containing protein [Pseudodesulfovibrio tunisiensis]|uniref:DUF3089 domain-containing protein n=1 Tax=Pseudodesulfovibrio tunisiensis TaxID=463192 RepID=UPI001FB2AB8D|nr:DUF3089 domain-containing protein [Pseudodesulfovibrio tunisiensis]
MKRFGLHSCLLFFLLAVAALPALAGTTPDNAGVPPCPDYADDFSWAAREATPDKPVDVFYVYPTIYPEASPKNMDIRRKDLRARAEHLLVAQAGVFSGSANLFAPFYRQVSFTVLDPEKDMFHDQYLRIGADDVHRAFDYYLARLNPDRPFILAGDSQGSVVLLDLLRRRFFEPALQERLVAAYLIGYSVTRDDLKRYPWLKIARRADDTGVIITFNTQAPGATGSPVLRPGAACVNPLNWTTTDAPADKSLNLGAVFFNEKTSEIEREIPGYAGARIDPETGALVTNPPERLDIGHFPPGVYHKYDYAFWYRNLERNAAERIRAYLAK